jgi:hypothetical protein
VWILQKHRSRYFTFQFFKQKLKLQSIYIFGESCSSCYTEHHKIEFAIVGFFCDFILNLHVASIKDKGGKNHFAQAPLEVSNLHGSALGLRTDLWEKPRPRNVVLGAWGGAVRRILVRPAAGLAGEEVRQGLGAPRSLWWPGLVWGGAGEGCTAVPGSCGRRGRNAGKGTARLGQQAPGQALACAWEPVQGVKRPCWDLGGRASRRRKWCQRRLRCGSRGEKAGWAFIGSVPWRRDHDHHARQGMARQGGGEARQPIAAQGRRGARTVTTWGGVRRRGHWLGGAAWTHSARGLGEPGGGMVVPGAADGPTGASVPRREGPGGRPWRACVRARQRRAASARERHAPAKQFQVALFKSVFLQIFQQKCSKVSIPKLCTTLPSTTFPKALGSFSQPVEHKSHAKFAVFWAPVNSNMRR